MTERLFLAFQYDNKIAWGGFHITLIGRGNKNSFSYVKRTSFYNSKKRWTFSNSPVASLQNWKGVWTIVFESQTIDLLADELRLLGYKAIKGPKNGSFNRIPWHISLNGVDKKLAKDIFNYIVKSPNRPYWYLTICTENPKGYFRWKRL
jgi:hypothetical protein